MTRKMRKDYEQTISDSEMDEKSTEELQDLILRARWSLYRRAKNASQALKDSDPGSELSP